MTKPQHPPADNTSFAVGITTQATATTTTTESQIRRGRGRPPKPKTTEKPRAIKKIKSQEEKRAELNAYMAKFRAKKKDKITSLQREIASLKLRLGEPPERTRICKCITDGDKKESPLKCKPKNIYLPPKEQLNSMTKEEVKAWRIAQRMERKRLAREKSDREQKELRIRLEGEVSRLKEKAILMGIPVLMSGTGSALEDAMVLGSEYCGACGLYRSSSIDDKFKLVERMDLDMPMLPEVPVPSSNDMEMGGNEDTLRSTDKSDKGSVGDSGIPSKLEILAAVSTLRMEE
eukprot:g11569.t1 g11569   contig6:116083-116952(+)